MNARLSLRLLLVLDILMLVAGVSLSFFDGYLLPDTLAEWKEAQLDEDALSLTDLILLALWLGWLGGYLVSVVGLFLQQRAGECAAVGEVEVHAAVAGDDDRGGLDDRLEEVAAITTLSDASEVRAGFTAGGMGVGRGAVTTQALASR